MNAFELMIDGSLFSSLSKLVLTPESYMGATTFVVVRKLWSTISRLAIVLTAGAMVFEMFRKYPKYFALVIGLIVSLLVLPGCASKPDFATEGYASKNTIQSRDLCSEYQQILLENRSTLVECHATKAVDTDTCRSALNVAANVRPAYRSCMEYEKDNRILPNPANVFTVPKFWRTK